MGNKNQCCDRSPDPNMYQEMFDKRISEFTNVSQDSMEYSMVNSMLSASSANYKVRLKPTPLPFPAVPRMFHQGRKYSTFSVDPSETDRRFVVLRGVDHGHGDRLMLQCSASVANQGTGKALVSPTSGDWLFEGLIDHWHLGRGLMATHHNFVIGKFDRNALDEFEATGECVWGDLEGGIYRGWMAKGLKHGRGLLVSGAGWSYEGEFFEDRISGQGRLVYTNEDIYTGSLLDGHRHGTGHMVYTNSGETYKGFWQKDLKEGYGTFSSASFSYSGEWSKDKMHGKGIVVYPDHSKHETVWVNGVCVSAIYIVQRSSINKELAQNLEFNFSMRGLGFGVWGLGFGVWGLGDRKSVV